jgi:hypothetical protein
VGIKLLGVNKNGDIKMGVKAVKFKCMGRNQLIQDKVQCWAFVYIVTNICVP